MSGRRRKFWRRAKAVLAFLCVPILVSALIYSVLGLLQLAIERMPESWELELPGILKIAAMGALFCVPVAWIAGPLTFGLDSYSGSRHLVLRQAAIGGCVGASIGGFFGLMFVGGNLSVSLGLVPFGLSLVVLGFLLGVIHALGLRYGLLRLGLIGPANDVEPNSQGTATDVRTGW